MLAALYDPDGNCALSLIERALLPAAWRIALASVFYGYEAVLLHACALRLSYSHAYA
jgi:hypothetical protein